MDENRLKVLFTGAGSIGTRHINNLTAECKARGIELEVDVLRKTDRVIPDDLRLLIRNEIRNDKELDDFYDIVFITDETKTHYENIIRLKNRCKHMFIEKPIFESVGYSLDNVKPENDSVYYVAAPIRFTNYYKEIRKYVETEDVYSARIIFSSYMPNWQKGRDYTKSFRCFAERGGGVDIDSLHEIDYMTSLFGIPLKVNRVAGKYSNLKMDACDIADYIFEYKDKLIEMHLDYFGRVPNRRVELFTKNDVIVIDFNEKSVHKQVKNDSYKFGPDDMFYQDEMRYFIDLVLSKGSIENINPISNAFESLKISKGFI
jgi:predicted dehydrogenase